MRDEYLHLGDDRMHMVASVLGPKSMKYDDVVAYNCRQPGTRTEMIFSMIEAGKTDDEIIAAIDKRFEDMGSRDRCIEGDKLAIKACRKILNHTISAGESRDLDKTRFFVIDDETNGKGSHKFGPGLTVLPERAHNIAKTVRMVFKGVSQKEIAVRLRINKDTVGRYVFDFREGIACVRIGHGNELIAWDVWCRANGYRDVPNMKI